jgi:uncharacterized OB-fold protein
MRHYPQLRCTNCISGDWHWEPVDGQGVVHSFTITHRVYDPAWAERVPYAVVTVELVNGIRMVSDLPEEDLGDVKIGTPVEVFFEDMGEVTLPRFRLTRHD